MSRVSSLLGKCCEESARQTSLELTVSLAVARSFQAGVLSYLLRSALQTQQWLLGWGSLACFYFFHFFARAIPCIFITSCHQSICLEGCLSEAAAVGSGERPGPPLTARPWGRRAAAPSLLSALSHSRAESSTHNTNGHSWQSPPVAGVPQRPAVAHPPPGGTCSQGLVPVGALPSTRAASSLRLQPTWVASVGIVWNCRALGRLPLRTQKVTPTTVGQEPEQSS